MRGVFDDIRFGLRLLRKNPWFALSCIMTLVLGVVLNTAAFGIMNALWFGKLPFRDDHQIVVVRTTRTGLGTTGLAWAEYQAAAAQAPAFSAAASFCPRSYNLTFPVAGAIPEQVRGGMMSSSALETLGYTPVLGRGFTAADEASYREAAGAPVVLISEGLWRRQFNADPSAVGLRLILDGAPATIIGVLPRSFRFIYAGYQVIAPVSRDLAQSPRGERPLQVLARVRPGMESVVGQQLEAAAARLNGSSRTEGIMRATPYRKAVFGEALKMYPILLAAALLLLLLMCANLSNLMMARMAARSMEVAIRMAIGAGRMRIVRQVFTEAVMLSAFGAALAILMAKWTRHIVVARVPELSVFAVDYRVVLYTLAVALVAAIVFALAPALNATRPQPSETLKAGGMAECRRGYRLRSAMMATQVAVAMALLTCTGLLIRSISNLRYVDKGLRLDGVVATTVEPKGARYSAPADRHRFWERLATNVAAAPGVETAGVTGALPLTSMPGADRVEVEGRAPSGPGGDPVRLARSAVDPRYMTTVRWPLFAGRSFTAADHAHSPRVALVNQAFAGRFWPDNPPQAIGKRIRVGTGEWTTIVGIVADARQLLIWPAAPEVIVPVAQAAKQASALVIRAPGLAPEAVKQIVLRELQSLDPTVPAGEFVTEDSIIEMFYPKVMISGLAILALVAIGLGTLGLYGVISFMVARRTRELGIRMALGATGRSIVALVLRDGLRVVLAGVAAGLLLALACSRALRGFLVDLPPVDPITFTAAPLLVMGVALLALFAPALRASRVQPSIAVRPE